MKQYKGFFLTLEGGEGAGKTTLLKGLANYFSKKGVEIVMTREPGGTGLGEVIRGWLLNHKGSISIGAEAELLLVLSARAQHIEEVILPALKEGKMVLCDRFNDSTVAYQGGARGLGIEYVQKLCLMVCHSVLPELTLFLDIVPEIGLSRSKKIDKEYALTGEFDRIESENLTFHHKIQQTFKILAEKEPHRIYTIDGLHSPDKVLYEAIQCVQERFL